MKQTYSKNEEDKELKWWQLSLLGIAGTIGTGYFLGSSLAISIGGPAVLRLLELMWYLMHLHR
ncbi:L-asparagine transporter-like permease [Fontibacillus solani]|uniref:L-asparagine transporter-like permease n=1 Tax=Fontibacillus solani TaxID=1572857 RepID=A0A7W3SPY4_9BACL|nr:L-asparagine transporter-like permease [Fontibacillus solani]